MRVRLRQTPLLVAAVIVLIATTATLAYLPSAFDFGLAVSAAAGWCLWIERYPAI